MARPIAFAGGFTSMGRATRRGHHGGIAVSSTLHVTTLPLVLAISVSDETSKTRQINYARVNYLVHRWNLDDAQANVFVWGGLGSATGNTLSCTALAENAGAQADYWTRRIYALL